MAREISQGVRKLTQTITLIKNIFKLQEKSRYFSDKIKGLVFNLAFSL